MRFFKAAAVTLVIALAATVNTAFADEGKPHKKEPRHSAHVMASPAHQAMYMQLLAEKYAPETADAWRQTMEERASLMKAIHEMRSSQRWEKDEARQKMKRFSKDTSDLMKQHKALMEEFTAAVQAKDEKAIKAVLPKLLQSEQKLNEALRKWVDSEKQAKKS